MFSESYPIYNGSEILRTDIAITIFVSLAKNGANLEGWGVKCLDVCEILYLIEQNQHVCAQTAMQM